MYDSSFVCTYHLIDEEDVSNLLYQKQFLDALQMTEWDDSHVDIAIDGLYQEMKDIQEVQTILETLKTSESLSSLILLVGNNDEILFRYLFSYDLFYLTHKVITEIKTHQAISKDTLELFVNKL